MEETQKQEFEDKLKQREEERAKQKEERDKNKDDGVEEEDPDFIQAKLKDQIAVIQDGLSKHAELGDDKKVIEAHFDTLNTQFKDLRDYLANILFCLPSYTQQSFQKEVDILHETLNSEREKAIPKSKFSFKMKKKQKKPKEEKKEEIKQEEEEDVDIFALIDEERDLVIKNQKGLRRIVLPTEYEGKDKAYLINIDNCDIYLPFVMKALYIKNVHNSRIYGGYVMGATFYFSTKKSTYHMASHQTRIHKAVGCDFYLFAKQGPIIEDCSELRFGPYKFRYPDSIKHETFAGFFNQPNLYHKVVDFKWIKKDKSPNFDVIVGEDAESMYSTVLEESDFK
ncbi:unnamed protein product [Moneuplotes crassus]|uniref:C-CAP/cofactor C-like domain-containing protein n=1 Tax=Euplotes crassus TaxID=5936 RepID=A0AAD1XKF6_EUPCR|nr:unnamed protein product [Moneuplotes crassus]